MGDEDTSVRVAVRIRPQIPREKIDMCRICTTVTPNEPQVTLGSDRSFTYDYMFDTHAEQEEIYDSCVANLVDGSLEGYNATILAYGQTGSGKTYSMGTGFDVDLKPEQVGIIPRAITHLFNGIECRINKAKDAGESPPEFKIVAQFMELYNEDLIDLFDPARDSFKGKTGIRIHEDASGGIYVMGITMKPVLSPEDALQCLRMGALSRTTGSTQMNSQSSRSHAIFTLHIKQQRLVNIEDPDTEDTSSPGSEFETLSAKFHFVDLAGSERLKRTGATGERAREGISINCGLLALGNVISALGDKSKRALHVPYRDSKLTRLLQDSLGGNSQTVMIACISPSDRDFMETLNTLNYANRARNIKNRVVMNQDKSSRTITVLRQEVQRLQLELQEYKQGKRIIGEDGVESVNDMFHENTMLQSEINNLRTRVKAMQETIDNLNNKNIQLLAEKATGAWLGAGTENTDFREVVEMYLKEIEGLKSKLLESESVCQQLRKAAARPLLRPSVSPHMAMSGHFDVSIGDMSSVGSLIAEAKRDLRKDLDQLAKTKQDDDAKIDEDEDDDEKRNGLDGNDDHMDGESDSDNDEKEAENEQYSMELAELTSEINIKQKLIEELERSQRRLQNMKQQYEDKLMQLQERIKATQEERDKVLASYSGQGNQPTDKIRKVRDEYERKLGDMQKEVKRLQTAKKEHARLLQNQSRHENQLKMMRNDLGEMKQQKVKLMNKIKEESVKHKQIDQQRNREIAQLRKVSRRHENQIRSLEAEKRVRDAVIKRKQEEVAALRKVTRNAMSNKAAGRLRNVTKRNISFSPKVAKLKWQKLEKSITTASYNKKTVTSMEREMERQMQEREALAQDRDRLTRKRNNAMSTGQSEFVIRDLNDQIESVNANIDYLQDVIKESQHNIMEIEDPKEGFDNSIEVLQNVTDIEEARYLISKLYSMTSNQSFMLIVKEISLKEKEAELSQVRQDCSLQQELLKHVIDNKELDMYASTSSQPTEGSRVASSSSSVTSSRSNSPTENTADNIRPSRTQKIRRKTQLPQELLYPSDGILSLPSDSASLQEQQDSNLMPQPSKSISRVPSAPGSLKTMTTKPDPPKPSPALNRKVYERQESTSPRPTRRTTLQTNLLGKPGSM